MRVYVIVTAVIFALITIAHVVRIVMEPYVLREPVYLFLTLLSAALVIWAIVLLRRSSR